MVKPNLSAEETERVTGRVEHNANIVLWLILCEGRPCIYRPSDSFVEIIYGDVEMQHHLLFARCCGPDGREVARLVLE